MQEVSLFLGIGVDHILSWAGLDHLLFIVALTAVYQMNAWRRVLLLITAFTIGHCTTLVLATIGWITASSRWVELLIPITILITSLSNLFRGENPNVTLNYIVALCFGLIHGMGFSATLRAMLGGQNLVVPLLSFNLGLELGQIVVVFLSLLCSYTLTLLVGVRIRDWRLVISSIIIGAACMLIKDRIF